MKTNAALWAGSVLILSWTIGFLLYINPKPAYWVSHALPIAQSVQDDVIYHLDRCTPDIPLAFCRLLYNKPQVYFSYVITSLLSQFTQENLFHVLHPILRLPALFFFYVGLVSLLLPPWKVKTNFLRWWIIIYASLGLFRELSLSASKSAWPLLFIIVIIGFTKLISHHHEA